MKIPYNILIQIKMSVRPYFKGFTLIFFFYNCRKQDHKALVIGNVLYVLSFPVQTRASGFVPACAHDIIKTDI